LDFGRAEEDEVGDVVEGAGEEDALAVAGGIDAADDVGGQGDGAEGEPEGGDLLGVAAALEAVEVALGGAGAGTAAAPSTLLRAGPPAGRGRRAPRREGRIGQDVEVRHGGPLECQCGLSG